MQTLYLVQLKRKATLSKFIHHLTKRKRSAGLFVGRSENGVRE